MSSRGIPAMLSQMPAACSAALGRNENLVSHVPAPIDAMTTST